MGGLNCCVQFIIIADGQAGGKPFLIKHNRIPIYYSLAYHSMPYHKDDPNHCAKEFLEYLKRVGSVVPSDISSQINARVLKIQDERNRR